MNLFDKTYELLEKKLDLAAKRHVLLSSNVANSETPNFRARELDFAGELQKVIGSETDPLVKTNPQHMDLSSAEHAHVVLDNSGEMGADGNNVDLDVQMGKLMTNARSYGGTVDILSNKFRLLRMVVGPRGGA